MIQILPVLFMFVKVTHRSKNPILKFHRWLRITQVESGKTIYDLKRKWYSNIIQTLIIEIAVLACIIILILNFGPVVD